MGSLTDHQTEAYRYYQNLSNDIKKRIHLLSHISNDNLESIKYFISEDLSNPLIRCTKLDNGNSINCKYDDKINMWEKYYII